MTTTRLAPTLLLALLLTTVSLALGCFCADSRLTTYSTDLAAVTLEAGVASSFDVRVTTPRDLPPGSLAGDPVTLSVAILDCAAAEIRATVRVLDGARVLDATVLDAEGRPDYAAAELSCPNARVMFEVRPADGCATGTCSGTYTVEITPTTTTGGREVTVGLEQWGVGSCSNARGDATIEILP